MHGKIINGHILRHSVRTVKLARKAYSIALWPNQSEKNRVVLRNSGYRRLQLVATVSVGSGNFWAGVFCWLVTTATTAIWDEQGLSLKDSIEIVR